MTSGTTDGSVTYGKITFSPYVFTPPELRSVTVPMKAITYFDLRRLQRLILSQSRTQPFSYLLKAQTEPRQILNQAICIVGAFLLLPGLGEENASGRTCRLALSAGFQDRGELGLVEKVKLTGSLYAHHSLDNPVIGLLACF